MSEKKLYTKAGDAGMTKDFAGNPLPKDDVVIVINGKIDALQSAIDQLLLAAPQLYHEMLKEIQKKLWQGAGEIANCSNDCIIWPISHTDLQKIEQYTDSLGSPPQKFVRFNTQVSIYANQARVRAREVETIAVKLLRENKLRSEIFSYINRLSSLFFMIAYQESKKE